MSRMKKTLQRMLLVVVTLGVTLVAAELILRWRERRELATLLASHEKAGVVPSDIPGLYYRLRPGASNATRYFNSQGFSMPERPLQKPPGLRRVVVVGDSVTQGVGAMRTSDAWPNQLDQLLSAATTGRVEVWNCGTGGYNVDQVAILLKAVVTNFAPDAILYGFCFNDYWGPNFYLQGQAAMPSGMLGAGATSMNLLDRLKQLRTAQQAKIVYDDLHYAARGYLPVFVDSKTATPAWLSMKDRIVEMRDFCATQGWPFGVVITPMPQFVFADDSRNRALHDLRGCFASNGIPFVDVTPAMRARKEDGLFVAHDNHPNATGYTVIAKTVASWILSTNAAGFVPAGRQP